MGTDCNARRRKLIDLAGDALCCGALAAMILAALTLGVAFAPEITWWKLRQMGHYRHDKDDGPGTL